ncbi:hypothetical protein AZE42_10346 [Rhizopogon vesiculosus]|uniref:Uncharacterized protein n=1 Tax=Rhizopogon vesiculosus TaxID=180088 RepID=A0A1J8Q008_9AGAM|nr:hypothetical protein AZE42_10346 [Rhizopogon vesiculosus]
MAPSVNDPLAIIAPLIVFLVRSVNDLTKWLSVLEVGFTTMLEQGAEYSIAEEQEEVTVENSLTEDTNASKWDSVTDLVLESS